MEDRGLERSACLVCNSKKIKSLGHIINGRYPKKLLSQYVLQACIDCGHKFVNPTPSDRVINYIYSTPDYTQWEVLDETGRKSDSRYLNFNYYSEIIRKYQKKGKVLDCGCASGQFLDVMKKKGFDCYGIETSQSPFMVASKKHPQKIFDQDIENLTLDKEFFDIITMFDFIEHTKNPKKVLQKASELLKPGGWLFIVTPNTKSFSAKLLGKRHNDYILEHLNLFNKKNIISILNKTGFEVKKIQPAKKIINLKFAEKVFGRHTNILYYPISVINRMLPQRVSHFPIKLNFGGMFVVAKKTK